MGWTGRYGLDFNLWIGIIEPIASQTEQVDTGFQWKYKVRIIGHHGDIRETDNANISNALVVLPTTAGSGGGDRIRTPRISEGDTVIGFMTQGVRYITGVMPRTRFVDYSDPGLFNERLAGFTENNKNYGKNSVVGGVFNAPNGPETPNGPPGVNATNRESARNLLEEIGINPNSGVSSNSIIKPPITPEDQPWNGGSITKQQLDYIVAQGGSAEFTGSNAIDGTVLTEAEIKVNQVNMAYQQALDQNIITHGEYLYRTGGGD